MTALTDLLYPFGCFAFGVIAGAQWTRMRCDLHRIAKAQPVEAPVASHEPTDEKPAKTRRWPRRVLDAVVVLAFISSAVQLYVTNGQIEEVVSCQRAYQAGFADALEARSSAAAAAQNALDELMSTVGQLTTGAASPEVREKFRTALQNYLAKRAEAKKQQQDNPYPPSPRDLCQ